MDIEKINNKFEDGFWTKKRPHVEKKEKDEDIIPFKWSKDAITGKKEVILSICKNREN